MNHPRSILIPLFGSALFGLFLLLYPLYSISASHAATLPSLSSTAIAPVIAPVDATVNVTATETVDLYGPVGSDLKGVFFLEIRGGVAHTLTMESGDLIGPRGDRIPGTSVTILPSTVDAAPTPNEPSTLRRFAVNVPAEGAEAGVYVGDLYIQYAELNGRPAVTVALTATFAAKPAVKVATDSANQTMFANTRWCDMPYVGVTSAIEQVDADQKWFVGLCDSNLYLGALPVYLEATTPATATVRQALMLNVRRADSLVLPAGVVTATAGSTAVVPAGGASVIQVVFNGHNVPAGAYRGTLRINVENMAAPVEAALNFNIRHHQLWAILTLILSFAVFLLTGVYNRNLARFGLAGKVEKRQRKLEGLFVDAEQRAGLRANLAALMDAVLDGATEGEIENLQKVYDEQVKDAVDEATTVVNGHLEPVSADFAKLDKAFADAGQGSPDQLLDDLQQRAETIRRRVEEQDYTAVETAQVDIQMLDADIEVVQQLQTNWSALDPDLTEAVLNATSVQNLVVWFQRDLAKKTRALQETVAADSKHSLPREEQTALDSLPERIEKAKPAELAALLEELDGLQVAYDNVVNPPPAGDAFALPPSSSSAMPNFLESAEAASTSRVNVLSAARERMRAWRGLQYRRRIITALAIAVAYMVALWVGWTTLYYASPTFGASPRDYLDLFFWGAAVNFVAGQSINLKSLYTRQDDNG